MTCRSTFATSLVRLLPVAVFFVFAPGCGRPAVVTDGGPLPGPANVQVIVTTATAPPGTTVDVTASGFDGELPVQIGFGPPQSEFTVVRNVRTDALGRVSLGLTVPDWARRGRPYVVVVSAPAGSPRAVSDPFVVGAPGDSVTVHGRLTTEGVECPALRGQSGELYTLTRRDLDFGAGTDVVVRGVIAGASFCMQGTTLNVASIERR